MTGASDIKQSDAFPRSGSEIFLRQSRSNYERWRYIPKNDPLKRALLYENQTRVSRSNVRSLRQDFAPLERSSTVENIQTETRA